jgi:hypothetical protein
LRPYRLLFHTTKVWRDLLLDSGKKMTHPDYLGVIVSKHMRELVYRPGPGACFRLGAMIFLVLLLLQTNSHSLRAQEVSEIQKSSEPPASVIIPDGTPVQLRFAQAVWGFPISPFILDPPRPPFTKGDAVRIVAAADVEIGGHIVIRRGSIGQATVMATSLIVDRKHPTTGIDLRIDWIKSISDQMVPLRLHKKGKPGGIILDVYSGHGGFSIDQVSLSRGLIQAMTFQYMAKSLHQKLWVPVGTRMIGFVHGSIPLDGGRLSEAEARLPLPNTTGLVTIYRVKGQKDQKPDVSCDGKALAPLGSRQFLELELPPGDHALSVSRGESAPLTISPGKEYYLWLRWHPLPGSWKLEAVSTPEGEDGISDGEMVGSS